MLRQPLESGVITISRAQGTVTYPAEFILLAAMNPCPCGYYGSPYRYCSCSPKQISTYQHRISGPIEDRIDILTTISPVDIIQERENEKEPSEIIRNRVKAARNRQYERYGDERYNGNVSSERLLCEGVLTDQQKIMLQQRSMKMNWSNRVQVKIIRLARTISDLSGQEQITDEAVWEAMTLRRPLQNKAKFEPKGSGFFGA